MRTQFPENFIWGAATAAYQIEGAVNLDGRGQTVWDVFSRRPGKIKEGHTGEIACDHYNRWRGDLDLMSEIGLKAYRFSLAWSRIQPSGRGKPNQKGLDFYSSLVDGLLEKGIEPWATLFHWDLPRDLYRAGAWSNPDIVRWFGDYAAIVAEKLGDRVKNWMTINEPSVFIILGHGVGEHAPGDTSDYGLLVQMSHHALLAHGRAVQAIRSNTTQPVRIGLAPSVGIRTPATESPADIEAARRASFVMTVERSPHDLWNPGWWLDPVFLGRYPQEVIEALGADAPHVEPGDMELISQPIDFCGFNYYTAQTVKADGAGGWVKLPDAPGTPANTLGWAIKPDGLYWAGKLLHERYNKPLMVTENGMPNVELVDVDGRVRDVQRAILIRDHLRMIGKAIGEGIDFQGYLHWSLMDNFEWSEGYRPRFGLIHVDYETQQRRLKDSARYYNSVIESNGARIWNNDVSI